MHIAHLHEHCTSICTQIHIALKAYLSYFILSFIYLSVLLFLFYFFFFPFSASLPSAAVRSLVLLCRIEIPLLGVVKERLILSKKVIL